MPGLSVGFGLLLAALGAVAYLSPDVLGVGKDGKPADPYHPTSLSPVVVGLLLVAAGAVARATPAARKHAMHAASVVALLGVVGGAVPVVLRQFRFEEVAVKVGLGMSLLSLVFLGLCVNSFVQARVLRKSQAPAA